MTYMKAEKACLHLRLQQKNWLLLRQSKPFITFPDRGEGAFFSTGWAALIHMQLSSKKNPSLPRTWERIPGGGRSLFTLLWSCPPQQPFPPTKGYMHCLMFSFLGNDPQRKKNKACDQTQVWQIYVKGKRPMSQTTLTYLPATFSMQ